MYGVYNENVPPKLLGLHCKYKVLKLSINKYSTSDV